MHTHTVAGMAAAALKDPIKNIDFSGMMFTNRIAFHDFEGVTVREEECERLANNLNNKDIMILRSWATICRLHNSTCIYKDA